MPSSFGLWFGAYAETLVDMHTLRGMKVADQIPWVLPPDGQFLSLDRR